MDSKFINVGIVALIVAYVFMGGVFAFHQRQGKGFIASFDKAVLWGSYLFVIGVCLDAITYVTWD